MNNISRITNSPKFSSLVIFFLFLTGILTAKYIEIWFRFSNHHWIYQYGSLLSKGLVLLMISWSFFHPIMVISAKRKEWRKYWVWILIGSLPFLYFGISILIALSRTVE